MFRGRALAPTDRLGAQSKPPIADWLTDGGNPQRTAWQKDEHTLNVSNVKGMKLLWKYKTDNQPREMHGLFPPLIVGRVLTAGGPKQVAVVAGVSDNIYAIDVASGTLLWKQHFDTTFSPPPGVTFGTLCPGGITATPVIGPDATPVVTRYAAAWDGDCINSMSRAGSRSRLELFMPAERETLRAESLERGDYTTSPGCGGIRIRVCLRPPYAANGDVDPGIGGMWDGPDLQSTRWIRLYRHWRRIYNPELRSYGTAVIAVKLDPSTKKLKLTDYYGPPNAEYLLKRDLDLQVTGPVFEHAGREWLVQGSKECRTWLLDTSALGGEDHSTAEHRSPLICNEDQDYQAAGFTARWRATRIKKARAGCSFVLGPNIRRSRRPSSTARYSRRRGSIQNGARSGHGAIPPQPRVDFARYETCDPPVGANGIVFGYASGEDIVLPPAPCPSARQKGGGTPGRISRSTHAVLYRWTVKPAKSYGPAEKMYSWNHYSGISIANGRVYIATYDGTVYVFGLPQ